jgi:hypothetical protein
MGAARSEDGRRRSDGWCSDGGLDGRRRSDDVLEGGDGGLDGRGTLG